MPVEKWSDRIVVAHLADDPQFSDDIASIEDAINTAPRDAVLDMTAIHYLNSSNISRLLKLRKRLHSDDRKLILCSISNQVWIVFMPTGLDRVFDFSTNVPMALATLQMT